MNQETKQLLQNLIDSMNHPSCVSKNKQIILTNEAFRKMNLTKDNFFHLVSVKDPTIKQQFLGNDTTLFEVIPEDITKLYECRKKLSTTVANLL